jgi:hypothetical protein
MVDQKYKRIYAMTPKTYRVIAARDKWLLAEVYSSKEEAGQSSVNKDSYILEAWPAERIVGAIYKEDFNESNELDRS